MSNDKNRQVILVSRPEQRPQVDNFRLAESPVPEPGPNEVLVRVIYLSIDPAMRGWMAEAANYSDPVPLGTVMRSAGVGRVEASNAPDYARGDYVYGWFGWQDWAAVPASAIVRKVDATIAPLSTALGVLGLNGVTAWYGLLRIAQPKQGEAVLVSTAAGAVGSAVGQIARIQGCRTSGLAGSDEKVRMCQEEFGYDAALNYREETDMGAAIDRLCPRGIDIYFDNVGGATLDAVLPRLRVGGRVVICGTIANDAATPPLGPRVERPLLVARARMQGFVIMDHFDVFPEAVAELAHWLHQGRLRYREDVVDGLARAPEALLRVLQGRNKGKQIVRVAAE